jgi:putative flippase GtrA
MSVIREGRDFILVGIAQAVADWLVFVAASYVGAPLSAANLGGRVAGALLGFWLNGAITFRTDAMRDRRSFPRYVVLWLAACLLSTFGVVILDATFGRYWAWLGKPVIDLTLGVASFVASRNWVYR